MNASVLVLLIRQHWPKWLQILFIELSKISWITQQAHHKTLSRLCVKYHFKLIPFLPQYFSWMKGLIVKDVLGTTSCSPVLYPHVNMLLLLAVI